MTTAFDYTRMEDFLRRNRYTLLLTAYTLSYLIFLLLHITPGLYITDEAVYLLMADSLTKDRSLSIWNGMEYPSIGLEFIKLVDIHDNKLYPQYPQLYTLIAAPFYILLGREGLILVNVLAFCGTMVFLYHTCRLLFSSEPFSFAAVVLYSAFTYSTRFALDLWPHSLTVFLVTVSVYLALKGVGDGKHALVFLSGFISALAIGVRYQAVIYSGILLLYVFLESRSRRSFVLLLAGMALPLALLSYFNYLSYGSFLSQGYSNMKEDFGGYVYFQFFALSMILVTLPYVLPRLGYSGSRLKPTFCVFTVVFAGFYLTDPEFMQHIYISFRVLLAEVFDISRFPLSGVAVPSAKKSVLQAAPLLALSLPGLVSVKNRERRSMFFMLMLLAFTEILFFSGRVNQHGGRTSLMRYFLQSLPYLSILTVYALGEVYSEMKLEFNAKHITPFIAFILFVSLPFTPLEDGLVINSHAYHRIWPVFLAAMLLILFTALSYGCRWVKPVFTVLVLASASYSLVVNTVEVVNGVNVRTVTLMLADELESIQDNSTVIFHGKYNLEYLSQLKTVKRVRIANAEGDNASTTKDLIEYYLDEGIPVYVVARMRENDFIDHRQFNNNAWIKYVQKNLTASHDINEVETNNLEVIELKQRER